ncbi:MAG: Smr/MutS family protein [Mariprofundales bacterium]
MDDDFISAMEGVSPLAKLEKKVGSTKAPPRPEVRDKSKTNIANTIDYQIVDLAHNHNGEIRAAGISNRNLRELRSGRISIDKRLDLHGFFREEALTLLENTVANMFQHRQRILCVVHGRGLHSEQGRTVLKQAVLGHLNYGLSRFILAAVPAPNSRGGATLIWLKKNKSE